MEHPTTPEAQSRAIAALVSESLQSAGISQRTAATATGIPLATLSRRLTGVSPFTVTELAAVARLLRTTVSALTRHASGRAA